MKSLRKFQLVMKIKKVLEYKSVDNPLMVFFDKGYTENIMGLDELTNIVEDTLIDSDVSIKRDIHSDSNPESTKEFICSVSFYISMKNPSKLDISVGFPYGTDSISTSDIINHQSESIGLLSEFIISTNSVINRTQGYGYILVSYNLSNDRTNIGSKKYHTLSITFLVS